MALKALTTKLEEKRIRALRVLSGKTRIPQSELIREGVDFVLRKYQEAVLTPEFKEEVENLLREDRQVLDRLAKA